MGLRKGLRDLLSGIGCIYDSNKTSDFIADKFDYNFKIEDDEIEMRLIF